MIDASDDAIEVDLTGVDDDTANETEDETVDGVSGDDDDDTSDEDSRTEGDDR